MAGAVPPADAGLLDLNATLIAEILAFLVMIAILARYAYPRIMAAAEARQRQIEEGVRAAQEAERRLAEVQREVAQLLEEARGQGREVLSRAHQEAAAEGEELRTRARRDAEAQVDRARSDIEAARDQAIQELRSQVGALVVAAAGRVIGQAIDEKAHKRLIDESIAEVSRRV